MFPYLPGPDPSSPFAPKTYGLMLMLAFAAATWVVMRRSRRIGVNPDLAVPMLVIAIVLGILGARLLHFLAAEPRTLIEHPLTFFNPLRGGMAVYGGVILAAVGVVLYLRVKGQPVWKMADVVAPAVLLAISIGRLGCFSAGCCHGAPCPVPTDTSLTGGLLPGGEIVLVRGFPWIALVFKEGVGVTSITGVPLYPTQLWESLGTFTLFLLLSWLWARHRRFDGMIAALALIFYPILRSTIEHFRGDTIRGTDWFGMFSTSQLVSIPVALLGVAILVVRWNRGVAPETPWQEDDDDLALLGALEGRAKGS